MFTFHVTPAADLRFEGETFLVFSVFQRRCVMSSLMFKRVQFAVLMTLTLCVVATQAATAAPPKLSRAHLLRLRIEAAKRKAALEAQAKQAQTKFPPAKQPQVTRFSKSRMASRANPVTTRSLAVKKSATQNKGKLPQATRRGSSFVGRNVAPAPKALTVAAKKKKKTPSQPRRMRLSTANLNVRSSTAQSSSTRQTAQTSQATAFTPQQRREFVELHAEYFAEIKQRRDNLSAKLAQIDQSAGSITGSRYVGFRFAIRVQVAKAQGRIGQHGSYTETFLSKMELRVPDEHQLDSLIDSLESIVKQLEERADDFDDEAIEDLADALDDLVDDADRLEGRLTYKTNRLKRKWLNKGGEVSYF
jgi:hypothetical protein